MEATFKPVATVAVTIRFECRVRHTDKLVWAGRREAKDMTYYEAALQILRSAGRPLTTREIKIWP